MLDRLPDPLIHRILSYAIPLPHPRTISRRYKLLLLYSRLSRSISRAAQQLLYTHTDIEDDRSAVRFSKAVDSSPTARRLAFTQVKSVRLSHYKYKLSNASAVWVLQRTPGAKEICLEGLKLDPLSLSVAASCETLYLFDCELLETPLLNEQHQKTAVFPRDTWHFPRLTSLVLGCSYFITHKNDWISLVILLDPFSLPALKSLSISYHDQTSFPEIKCIASQLTHLFLRRMPLHPTQEQRQRHNAQSVISDLPKEDLTFCSSQLLHLAIDIHKQVDFEALASLGTHKSRLPPQLDTSASSEPLLLRSLRLESPFSTVVERALLAQLPTFPSLSDLSHVILSDLFSLSSSMTKDMEKEKQTRDLIKTECEARGIQVVEMGFLNPEKGVEAFKVDFSGWRKACEVVDAEVELQEEEEEEEDGVELVIERVEK